MGPFVATLAILVGTSLLLLAFRERQKANPDQKIPHFSSPRSNEGRALVYVMIGCGLLGGTTGYLGGQMPLWAVMLVVWPALIAYTALIIRHNRQVDQQILSAA